MLFFNWRLLLLIIHTGAWWSFIRWCTSWSSTWSYNGIIILAMLWLSCHNLTALSLHSGTIMDTWLAYLTVLINMIKSTWMLTLRMWAKLGSSICLLLRIPIGYLDWSIPEWLKYRLRVGRRARLLILLLLWVFAIVINLLKRVAISDDHTMVIRQHVVMELCMMILAHSKRSLSWLWTNFGRCFWSSVLLKLWGHLVLARSIMWMLIIWWCRNPLIDLMGSYMSTWSSILRNMLIHSLVSNLLWSWTWSLRAIYRILMSITWLLSALFLAHDTTMTCWLSTWELIMLISWSICRPLFHWLIGIDRRSMLSMIRCGHIW